MYLAAKIRLFYKQNGFVDKLSAKLLVWLSTIRLFDDHLLCLHLVTTEAHAGAVEVGAALGQGDVVDSFDNDAFN